MLKVLFFALVVRPFLHVVTGTNVRHRDRLPSGGPALLVANHNSHLDTVVLMSLFPARLLPRLRPAAAADYFLKSGPLAWFSRNLIGIIPVTRGGRAAGDDPLAGVSAALREGAVVIFFPEGSKWLEEEARRLKLTQHKNPVDVGVRVELPASVMEHLTNATYEPKLVFYSKKFDDRVRTFCVNPYGEVVKEYLKGIWTVNGHSYTDRRTHNTNFALLVSTYFTEPFDEPISYGRYSAQLANFIGKGVIVQRLGDLQAGRRSTHERIAKGIVRPSLADATPGDLSFALESSRRHSVLPIEVRDGIRDHPLAVVTELSRSACAIVPSCPVPAQSISDAAAS